MKTRSKSNQHVDVLIIGGGLAGLSLARHLLLSSNKTVLVLDRQSSLPTPRQKVGESTVQVGGYYFSRLLDLEEHLMRDHLMKYNLRFYWKNSGGDSARFECFSQSYIRNFSNIACYQLDRNRLESELISLNRAFAKFTLHHPANDIRVDLNSSGRHRVTWEFKGKSLSVDCSWVIDSSGRERVLARKLDLRRKNPIRHGAYFIWVDGLVDIERLTASSPDDIRKSRTRASTGHLPLWLATNHFMGEGFWFWVIPLRDKTSLGLVYDSARISSKLVSTPERLIDWVCREFPLFRRDLPRRTVLDRGGFADFSFGCSQTISEHRWALTGESGRFLDPLYSPGSDFIAIHNSMIVDCILEEDSIELATKCRVYERTAKALYDAFLPSFSTSYDALGSQETFALKYVWELSIYYSFYVFPFINDLFTTRRFCFSYLSTFQKLGGINRRLQEFISSFYQWKKSQGVVDPGPCFFDFTSIESLRRAESTFYEITDSLEGSREVLESQLASLTELARYIVTYISSVVVGENSVLTNRRFVESIHLDELVFDVADLRRRYKLCASSPGVYEWNLNPYALERFRADASTREKVSHRRRGVSL